MYDNSGWGGDSDGGCGGCDGWQLWFLELGLQEGRERERMGSTC